MRHPTVRIIHTTVFVTPVVEHWLEREIAKLNNVLIILLTSKKIYDYLVLAIYIFFFFHICNRYKSHIQQVPYSQI